MRISGLYKTKTNEFQWINIGGKDVCATWENLKLGRYINIVFDKSLNKKYIQYVRSDICGDLIISEEVDGIIGGAFTGCQFLKSVIMPDSITKIGEYAFNGCANLEKVWLPDSLTNIGKGAFKECALLK